MSDARDFNQFQFSDISAAFSLLTRLPVPVDHALAGKRAARATWAYPLVGACLGGLAALLAGIAIWLGAPVGIAGALAIATLTLSTGAMHEDGLADCADGLGGGRDADHRLEIMKDSRIGAYGASALALAFLARWSGVETLGATALFWPLIAVGAASRLPMVLAMFLMPPARKTGLSAGVGLPPPASVIAAGGLAALICLIALGFSGLLVLFWAVLAPLPLFWLAGRLIHGQTGDILGGSQQLAEIAALSAACAILLG
jgi:adenosylcobinamide-GDP ribazoletransferase